jgi:hypothetical protein
MVNDVVTMLSNITDTVAPLEAIWSLVALIATLHHLYRFARAEKELEWSRLHEPLSRTIVALLRRNTQMYLALAQALLLLLGIYAMMQPSNPDVVQPGPVISGSLIILMEVSLLCLAFDRELKERRLLDALDDERAAEQGR